jgi:hypothetical protein
LLNTVVPQIQAAQAGDSYVMVVNATTPALRITQTGTGNALEVEDSANPDATPFVVTAAGDVGIGTNAPTSKLDVNGQVRALYTGGFQVDNAGSMLGKLYYSGGLVIDRAAATNLIFALNGSTQAVLDASGNLGLGVTPSAWVSSWKALQVGASGSLAARNDIFATIVGQNWFINSSGSDSYIGNGLATFYRQTVGQHQWITAANNTSGAGVALTPTQAMTLDASGNLGVGTTSPSALLDVNSGGVTAYASPAANFFRNHGAQAYSNLGGLQIYWNTSNGSGESEIVYGNLSTSYLRFIQNNAGSFTERARITSSGEFLVGTQTSIGVGGLTTVPNNSAGAPSVFWNRTATASTSTAAQFRDGGTAVGEITYTNTATAYVTSSDYRLKNTIAPMTGALAKVALLKPCTYKWNADGSDGEGFIAHELAEVVPQCVTGQKDAVDAEGKPVYQGIDTSFLVATLTAAIQELKAEVDSLKAQLEAK